MQQPGRRKDRRGGANAHLGGVDTPQPGFLLKGSSLLSPKEEGGA